MPRKRKADSAAPVRRPITASSLLGRELGDTEFRGGVNRPVVSSAHLDPSKERAAKIALGSGLGVGGQKSRQAAAGERSAGMLIDNVQTSRAFLSGYALEAYRTSYANGLNNRSGTYDIPGYFVQMNQLNGGILYWPATLQEKYQWYRYFQRTDAYIGRAMDLLSDLPMSKLTLNMPKMKDEKLRNEILEFFKYQIEKIGLFELCQNILSELNVIGNTYLYHEYNEELMMWERVVMLPPEEVYVFQYPFSDNKRVEYRPERLMALIKSDGKEMVLGQAGLSEDIIKHIPQELVDMVRKEGCIVMDSDPLTGSFCAHIARRKQPYMDLGSSILERVLVPLLQKENYRYTQLSLANRNMTPKNLITAVGLLQDQLNDLRTQVDLSYLDPDYSIVTNYEVTWNQIGAQDRLLNLDSEYERIENQIFAAMGVTRELLTGEGSYAGNKITVEILNTMFMLSREVLTNYIERSLFLPLAEKHGWFETGSFGVKKYYYPKVGFNRLTIRDNNEVFESLFQLYQKGSLNVDVIYELFNLNGEEIKDKLLQEAFTVLDPTFNRLFEEVHAEVGRNLSTTTNVLERITKGLNLTITNPPNQPQGQEGGAPGAMQGAPAAPAPGGEAGMGEGFSGFGENSQGEGFSSFGEGSSGESGTGPQGVQGPSVDELADVIAEEIPEGASSGDIADITNETLKPKKVKKPDLDAIAESIAESLPQQADEGDISDVVEEVAKE